MKAAIENFAKINAHNKVLMLGAMMELGEESIAEHESIVQLLQQYNWTNVVLVGSDYAKFSHPFIFFEDVDKAKDWFKQQQLSNSHILIKGSRSMKMEKVLED
jgi:UDP-N-acetylmuramoyl-tripeptide--D-alanyl-D-alanine ligase